MSQQDFLRHLPDIGAGRQGFFSRIHLDLPLLLGLLALMSVGLSVLYSASQRDMDMVLGQGYRFILGFVAMVIFAQIPPNSYRLWSLPLYLVGLLLLVAVLVFGDHAKGAQRWLLIPGVGRFQPSEIMKLAVPLMVARYVADHSLPPRSKPIIGALLLVFVPAVLVAKQPDLGTALLIAAGGMVVLFLSGLSWRLIGGFVVLASAASVAVWPLLHDYQRNRVLTFLDPERDKLGTGWNIIQSTTAIGSGGTYGKGWLHGSQSYLDFLPESHTDFIIGVLGEEFGLMGVCILMVIYLFVIGRSLYIAVKAQDSFSRLVAGCIAITFFVYVFVNMGMVSGLLPVVGVPLPLISYGGTSLVTLLATFGILMSIQTHRKLLSDS